MAASGTPTGGPAPAAAPTTLVIAADLAVARGWRQVLAPRLAAQFRLADPDRALAEAAIGLAILVVFFRNRGTIEVEDVNVMKG